MPRRGYRKLRLMPINSVKNIVDNTSIGVAAATTTTVSLGTAVNNYTGAVNQVPIGAKVSSIYLFFQIQPQATVGVIDAFVIKRPLGVTAPVPGVTGGDVARRFILHEEKGIPGIFNNGASPATFRGVIKIPKGRMRFGEGDELEVHLRCSTAYDACVKCIYKFYQ